MAKLFITSLLFFVVVVIVIVPISTDAESYNVINFGAKPNGQTVATKSFLLAWSAACKSTKPSTLYVPQGKFLLRQIVFEGPCRNRVTVKIDGTILAPSNYWALGNTGNWILFIHVNGISVFGGTLDGRGSRFWTCRRFGKNCPQGARSITFSNSKNILISGLTSINSQMSHMNINGCTNVVIKGVNINAPSDSPNTDGIHVQSSYGVTITDSSMKTGDDCISIGPGTKKLLIDRVKCGPGHGISIGSLARDFNEAGVEDVTVRNTVFTGSDNGLRIKSWARPSTGYVKGILYQNIVMNNVKNPIIIDQMYCPGDQGCPNQHSGISINGVTYQNVHGSSATPVAVHFHCSASDPCRGIKMINVKLTLMNGPAKSFCANADGTTSGFVIPGSCL